MKTAGEILKKTRLAKGYTLDAVEQATKIRVKFLEAIEKDDFQVLPSTSYAKGFVKNYSEFLGLESSTILAFFRRQTRDIPKTSLLPNAPQPLNQPLLALTPGRFLTLLLVGLLVVFLLYFGLQYRRLRQSPPLILEIPQNQMVTSEKWIDVSGKTDPDATVTINGRSVLVKNDGSFFDQVPLALGINKITVLATSRFGKTTTKIIEVGLQQP